MCNIAPENIIYLKLLGLFILGLFLVGQITGGAIFRTKRVYKADDPNQYWLMQIAYLLFAGWLLYHVYFC
jgi:hypothetical protein